jgi:hypothetical protein
MTSATSGRRGSAHPRVPTCRCLWRAGCEQGRLAWLDLVHADLEAAGYAVGALDLCAAGVGAPHIRQRLFFVADTGPTPNAMEGGQTSRSGERKGELLMGGIAKACSWSTPSARDWKDTAGMAMTGTNPDGSQRSRLDQLPRQASTASCEGFGIRLSGCSVEILTVPAAAVRTRHIPVGSWRSRPSGTTARLRKRDQR